VFKRAISSGQTNDLKGAVDGAQDFQIGVGENPNKRESCQEGGPYERKEWLHSGSTKKGFSNAPPGFFKMGGNSAGVSIDNERRQEFTTVPRGPMNDVMVHGLLDRPPPAKDK